MLEQACSSQNMIDILATTFCLPSTLVKETSLPLWPIHLLEGDRVDAEHQ